MENSRDAVGIIVNFFANLGLSKNVLNEFTKFSKGKKKQFGKARKLDKNTQITILHTFSVHLKAKAPIDKICKHMLRYGSKEEKKLASRISTLLQAGKGISGAFEGLFEPVIIPALKAGESNGLLVETMESMSEQLSASTTGISAAFKKCAQPLVYVIATSLMLVWMIDFVIKDIAQMFVETPDSIKTIYLAGDFYKGPLLVVLAVAVVIYACMLILATEWTGKLREEYDDTLFSIFKLKAASSFLVTFSLLRKNQIMPEDCLRYMSMSASPYLKYHLQKMKELSAKGVDDVKVINTGMIDEHTISYIRMFDGLDSEFINAMNKSVIDLNVRIIGKYSKMGGGLSIIFWLWAMINLILILMGVMSGPTSN